MRNQRVRQAIRVTNSFSQEEVEVMNAILEKAPMISEFSAIIRRPAFALLYSKSKRMRDQARERAHGQAVPEAV